MIESKSRLDALKERMAAKAEERRQRMDQRKPAPVKSPEAKPPTVEPKNESGNALTRIQQRLQDRTKRKQDEAEKVEKVIDVVAPIEKKESTESSKDSSQADAPTAPVGRQKSPTNVAPLAGGLRSSLGSAPEASFEQLSESGQGIAKEMERGQAETPMAAYFSALPVDPGESWPDIVIIGLTSRACHEALSWMAHLPPQIFTRPNTMGKELTEISFQPQGFRFEAGAESRAITADNLVDFATAMKKENLPKQNFVKMEVPSPPNFSGSKIYIPGDAQAIEDQPAVFSRIASQASLLILAGHSKDEFKEGMQQAVSALAPSLDAVLPVVFGKEEEDGWTAALKEMKGIDPLSVVAVNPTTLTPGPSEALSSDISSALSGHLLSRRLKMGIDLISERQSKRERDIRKRQADAQRMQKHLDEQIKGSNAASKDLLDELRQGLDDQIGGIQDWSKSRNKRHFSPTGELTAFAEELSGELDEVHLEKVESAAARRFGLPQCVLQAIEDQVVDRLKNEVNVMVDQVKDRLSGYAAKVEERLADFHQHQISIELPELNEREIWREIRQYCQIDPKIGIDLPKRDALRMFMSGSRQFIMPITMILGGALGNLVFNIFGAERGALGQNPFFTGTLVGLMFVGIVLFVRNAKALDREKMAQSLEKMRETVRGKILREMERVEKEKMEMIQNFLNDLKDELQNNLRTWVDEAISASQKRLERENTKVKSAGVVLQKRVRDVDQTRREVEGLEESCRSVLKNSASRLFSILGIRK